MESSERPPSIIGLERAWSVTPWMEWSGVCEMTSALPQLQVLPSGAHAGSTPPMVQSLQCCHWQCCHWQCPPSVSSLPCQGSVLLSPC